MEEAYRRFETGRWEEARRLLDAVRAGDLEGDDRVRYAVTRSWIDLLMDNVREAHDAIDLARREGPTRSRWYEWMALLSSQLALDEGDLDGAETELVSALASGEALPLRLGDWPIQLRIAIGILAELAEHARAAGDHTALDRYRARGRSALSWIRQLGDLMVYPASPSMRWPLGEMLIGEAEASRLDGNHDPASWAAAAAHWREVPETWRVAYCEFREAEARLESGQPRRTASDLLRGAHASALGLGAGALCRKIEALANRAAIHLEGPRQVSPSPQPVAGDPHGLTRREAEVLTLLAEGLTNRQIAERLFISESTAGVHVSHILSKLGVGARAAAAAIGARMAVAGEQHSATRRSFRAPTGDADA
jgi:DNA-binding CsgD family transcriptional regulator